MTISAAVNSTVLLLVLLVSRSALLSITAQHLVQGNQALSRICVATGYSQVCGGLIKSFCIHQNTLPLLDQDRVLL